LDRMSSLESLPALNTLKMLSTLSIMGCKLIKKLPDSFIRCLSKFERIGLFSFLIN
jgi:hypothetical protein